MPKTINKFLTQWLATSNASLLTARIALQVSLSLSKTYQAMLLARSKLLDQHLPMPPNQEQWFRIQRQPAGTIYDVGRFLIQAPQDRIAFRRRLKEVRKLRRQCEHEPEAFRAEIGANPSQLAIAKLNKRVAKLQARFLNELVTWLDSEMNDESNISDEDFGQALAERPKLYAYVRMTLPAMFLYQKTPVALLKEAESDNPCAVEKLIRLDNRMASHPIIDQWVCKGIGSTRIARSESIHTWARQGLNGRWDFGAFRSSMAAMISAISGSTTYRFTPDGVKPIRLTARAIQDLFLLVDKMRQRAGTYDSGYPCAFSDDLELASVGREIRRHRQSWIEYWGLPSDKSDA